MGERIQLYLSKGKQNISNNDEQSLEQYFRLRDGSRNVAKPISYKSSLNQKKTYKRSQKVDLSIISSTESRFQSTGVGGCNT